MVFRSIKLTQNSANLDLTGRYVVLVLTSCFNVALVWQLKGLSTPQAIPVELTV
ncbi:MULTISPECIES: hypothetical protein [Okeania]|uniref:hypothetical protein n=1 Tax=Okeania TaxID=1458928 RepID=UPI001374EC11|nr:MULTISPECIES: hypothetical protein [Okeania]NEP07361.1 hypothetical protein [Okeania sp. SIO4D6]NEP40950.1 hypothetical protein [Okeania sp. SIO2H7]NET13853.1 hypothetical protein [Okeania sp. SIO1H6]NEP75360.1 hypothetical protein [Okeania sp. SIO2G5]NEP95919.1 hypothetical protein [Okeania sp. SIO2F5]